MSRVTSFKSCMCVLEQKLEVLMPTWWLATGHFATPRSKTKIRIAAVRTFCADICVFNIATKTSWTLLITLRGCGHIQVGESRGEGKRTWWASAWASRSHNAAGCPLKWKTLVTNHEGARTGGHDFLSSFFTYLRRFPTGRACHAPFCRSPPRSCCCLWRKMEWKPEKRSIEVKRRSTHWYRA